MQGVAKIWLCYGVVGPYLSYFIECHIDDDN